MATLIQPRIDVSHGIARSRAKPNDRFVYFAIALGYLMLLPPQFNVTIYGSVIPPYRFFLLASPLLIVPAYILGRWKWVLPDSLMLVGTAWIWLALSMTTEPTDAFTSSVAMSTDIGLAYFFGRAAFRTLRDIRLFLLFMVPGLALMAIIVALESVLHRHLLQPFVGDLLGVPGRYLIDERIGLMRSRGPFPHPILAGIFFASFLPLYWLSGVRGWPRFVGIASSFMSFFTVSSAALLAITVSVLLISYNWLSQRVVNFSWRMFFAVSAIVIFALEFGTKSGSFNLIMRFASLNSYSAFNRVLIWRYGTMNVEKHPWFGIGYAEWERPHWMFSGSIDHYWLLLAIQYGLVPPVTLAASTILALLALNRRSMHEGYIDKMAIRGMVMALAVFALGIVSVSIWLSTQVWYHVMLGFCVSIGYNFAREQVGFRPGYGVPLQANAGLDHRLPHLRARSQT